MDLQDDDQAEGMQCVLPFDTDDPAFIRGFEAGRIWSLLQDCDGELEEFVHANNTEMMLRMAEALGLAVSGEPVDETWTVVRFAVAIS